ncbi:hypothetical protein COW36_19950 [bacterium (Candidatus Blackallbacteria) CG17_big_fil_post_rev_8_21_14_2_50_48_46]|uniref:Peptidase S8/S53 domain-containing protein n=1 Tax=bacterium (Candidatus Blackallbacteria) CG17_big_fil_post_rev_8_21_14_2_50_48_46 TaxID=2014261 RepID=A0A2M7FZS6_9BACT|nr:MAG: hypothetical protein COW64_15345 [bacterium (Candidatus Blackallbacteria) CG18_big_fil_WC_8_21_14_2_50_49_26]PIW14922.1 MAG: hypothetical protein COW36_19950 [bacterium (Candidatus Blackallbacteria) CG17_big_fil_post_rev_8_21_14_2_50_48_46]PIW44290.1 MAG: hypothetical protein COW20_24410 [bacterium (Candidatus Blackallbacteria) CG13_big_fil_rev_8_21_14_2_50_49_14]
MSFQRSHCCRFLGASVLLLALAGCQQALNTEPQQFSPPAVLGHEILVRYQLPPAIPPVGLTLINRDLNLYAWRVPQGHQLAQDLQNFQRDPQIRYAEVSQIYPMEPFQVADLPDTPEAFAAEIFPKMESLWNLKTIQVPEAWKQLQNPQPVKVAIIDSGVDPQHPFLKQNLLPLEDIWNEVQGKDILRNLRDPSFNQDYQGRDGNGHGTHIAGIIQMVANQGKPEGPIQILPIKATNLEGATDAHLLTQALQRAMDKDAELINLSIGTVGLRNPSGSQALKDMVALVQTKGIAIVAATGNESQRSRSAVARISAPAFYEGVISVGAVTDQLQIADYSNGGPEIELVAPGGGSKLQGGEKILSTWPTYPTLENFKLAVETLGYASTSGTSMATPHVTGTLALILSQEPHLNPTQLRARLMVTATPMVKTGFDSASGWGRLDAFKALTFKADDAN